MSGIYISSAPSCRHHIKFRPYRIRIYMKMCSRCDFYSRSDLIVSCREGLDGEL